MKYIKNIIALAATMVFTACSVDVASDEKKQEGSALANAITTEFKVWGNCEMCEETIEGALKVPGVSTADWDTETKQMKVSYDSAQITVDDIQQKIAATGYDTEKYKGSDEAYANLHECCQYERKP